MSMPASDQFNPLAVAVLTVSDSRGPEQDSSGDFLAQALQSAGHKLAARALVPDDIYRIRAQVSAWIADPHTDAILITGGTGFSGRDSTPEAIAVLFDKPIDGFGELFRHLSLHDIGTSTIQSRALAGFANHTVIFAMPGSTGACELAWQKILLEQLDSRHRPCNFYGVLRVSAGRAKNH
ncbi:MAG: molybdenum cofactor biosynthesis protein B [Gammaproteobacteria bacterium]|nr:molybdenum cofactor biosynthesis protein B [Gammaproteobacteria bacterium]NNL11667.1 molybdenum cofactor biosynthesis protein B [Pseudomonadales bacterium]NNM10741.1 molybdenum cofactor biosynthesis protein B [Pseudomonadales bacterium]RZV48371.1 MAG: molybdenum cofactor biosynthesis protein B [Pseudomonadales bacterium]